MALVKEYLELTSNWKYEYGEQTIVLMQVGSFFEVYALRDADGNLSGSEIEAFSRINGMAIANKTKMSVGGHSVVMAGFGLTQLEKYVTKLQSHDYTLVIYTQDVQGKNTTRSLSEIISPGTHFSSESTAASNITMAIWLEHVKANRYLEESVVIGIATLDVYTGKTTMFQMTAPYFHNPTTYDELERQVSIHRPSECLIVSNLDEQKTNDVIAFTGLSGCKLHHVSETKEIKHNAEKQQYQLETFRRMFPDLTEETVHTAILQTHAHASQALVLLLDFVFRHSPHLTAKLEPPIFEYETNRLLLANHSLQQLNILDDGNDKTKVRSVAALMNNCVTPMGRRRFEYELLHPITNIDELRASYDMTDQTLTTGDWETYRTQLNNVVDMEKWKRKLVMRRTMPKDVATLYYDLRRVSSVLRGEVPRQAAAALLAKFEQHFIIDRCTSIGDMSNETLLHVAIEELAFLNDEGITAIHHETINNRRQLEAIANTLSSLIATQEKGDQSKKYVKIHETAKSDPLLLITKRRSVLLKQHIAKMGTPVTSITFDAADGSAITVDFDLSTLTVGTHTSMECVKHTLIASTIANLQRANYRLVSELQTRFRSCLESLQSLMDVLDAVIQEVIALDVCQNKCYIAQKYNYCKPEIDDSAPKSFCDFKDIRHPLIEKLQTNELYVTNDLSIGNTMDGMLIYGTNAVGKTSFIKSVGIAVVMAQAGLYVPCSQFVYSPYTALFTRILGNDNLFKGLSTFAVEMSELRAILVNADENSLILGDELCSGTESDSALSIFTAGLESLHERRSSFLFATHFHEVATYDEIKAMSRLRMAHMAVYYDRERDVLVYDRKLREGSGESMYGLEVCKSLNLPSEFLARAHDLRNKYDAECTSVLSERSSHFNAQKLNGMCELCKVNRGTEVHHLQHQSRASKTNNYIDTFHKNHAANLANICEECHRQIHASGMEHKKVKTTNGWSMDVI